MVQNGEYGFQEKLTNKQQIFTWVQTRVFGFSKHYNMLNNEMLLQ